MFLMKKILLISLLGITSLVNAMDLPPTINEDLFDAIDGNDMATARQLLNEELQRDPNFLVVPGLTIAKTAEMAQMLIDEYGADVNKKFVDGSYLGIITPLHRVRTKEVAEVLLAHNANTDVRTSRGGKMTPLNAAFDIGVMEALLKAGADPNSRSREGITPLCRPAGTNNKDEVRLLIMYGADPDLQDNKGDTPRELAQRSKSSDVLRLFEFQDVSKKVGNTTNLLRNREMFGSVRNPYENFEEYPEGFKKNLGKRKG